MERNEIFGDFPVIKSFHFTKLTAIVSENVNERKMHWHWSFWTIFIETRGILRWLWVINICQSQPLKRLFSDHFIEKTINKRKTSFLCPSQKCQYWLFQMWTSSDVWDGFGNRYVTEMGTLIMHLLYVHWSIPQQAVKKEKKTEVGRLLQFFYEKFKHFGHLVHVVELHMVFKSVQKTLARFG